MWLEEEGNRCPKCGTYWWQWKYYDEEAGKWRRRLDHPLEADLDTCLGCRDVAVVWGAHTAEGKEQPGKGVRVLWFARQPHEGADAAVPHDHGPIETPTRATSSQLGGPGLAG